MNELAATNTAENSLNSTRLSGWGNYPKLDCRVYFQRRIDDLQELLGTASSSLIARGLGRSYGDSAVNSDGVLLQRTRDRFLSFDVNSGCITCEAEFLSKKSFKWPYRKAGFYPRLRGLNL